MVQTQVRLLANSRATRSVLISTVAQWLSFLGVHAQVEQLKTANGKIHLCLTVDKPEACDSGDWQKIVGNLGSGTSEYSESIDTAQFTTHQQITLQRLLAYLIQVGSPAQPTAWEKLQPQLEAIGFDESTLLGVRSALKVPQSLDDLMDGLDADVAAIALPKAVSLAMMDRQVNQSEDQALAALLKAMNHESAC
ncbi:hypothetical protein [Leptolyngbya sp. Cla-17]|uniref:hypothetical protein n=1 Tax=Leptolyngbya sp. Cla-17 TaxID=2803751 RepID=UPI0018D7AFB1|nr:hypothetical protein [Leptolyngbya sp. Cla-17]